MKRKRWAETKITYIRMLYALGEKEREREKKEKRMKERRKEREKE